MIRAGLKRTPGMKTKPRNLATVTDEITIIMLKGSTKSGLTAADLPRLRAEQAKLIAKAKVR